MEVEQVKYSLIIDLKQQAVDENKKEKEEEEINVAPTTDTSDRNVLNLGGTRRNTQEEHHYYRHLMHGTTDNILELLEQRNNIPEMAVVLKDELFLQQGFSIKRSLPCGGFAASVDLCLDISSDQKYIRKKIKKTKFRTREVEHLCLLNSRNISKILGFCVKSDCYEILQEYCGLDLSVAMRTEWKLIINEQLDSLIIQIAEAIYHCNSQNIFHLDIKPQNICIYVHQNWIQLKLADFGASKKASSKSFAEGVTLMYAAPEIHYDCCKKFLLTCDKNSEKYQEVMEITQHFCNKYHTCDVSEKCDLFSVGLVCLFIKWQNDPWRLMFEHVKYSLPKMYSRQPNIMKQLIEDTWGSLTSLISNLLTGDPLMRWTLDDIFVFMRKLKDERQENMDVSNSPQMITEVDAVQPTDNEMRISPNIPNMELLF